MYFYIFRCISYELWNFLLNNAYLIVIDIKLHTCLHTKIHTYACITVYVHIAYTYVLSVCMSTCRGALLPDFVRFILASTFGYTGLHYMMQVCTMYIQSGKNVEHTHVFLGAEH